MLLTIVIQIQTLKFIRQLGVEKILCIILNLQII